MTREQEENWRKLRAAVLERDNYTCYRCEKHVKNGRGLSVHHVIAREHGGEDDMENLITLCHPCHDFVEIAGYKSLSEISTSADNPVEYAPEKPIYDRVETFERPSWHARVYGGVRA